MQKRLNQPGCRLGCGLRWEEGTTYWTEVQIPTRQGTFDHFPVTMDIPTREWTILTAKRANPGHARPGDVRQSSQSDSAPVRFGYRLDCTVLDGEVHIDATWRLNRSRAAAMLPYVK